MVEPLKNRQAKNIADGWDNIDQQFTTVVLQPHTYVLDNEVYNTLKKAFERYTDNYQLVPPHSNQASKAERTIQTFKEYLKAGLGTVYPEYPITNWDILLTQAVMTLNMLRDS